MTITYRVEWYWTVRPIASASQETDIRPFQVTTPTWNLRTELTPAPDACHAIVLPRM